MLVLFGPIVLLAVLSFDKATIIALDWQGFTTQWYRDAWVNTDLRSAVQNSLVVAVIVTVISMVLGTMSAFAITRFRFRGRGSVAGLVGAPLVVPWLMIGVGAAIFFFHYHVPDLFPLSLYSVTAVQIICTFPLVTAVLAARLARFEGVQEEAAVDLGASRLQVLRRVILPQLTPALGAAAIFAFSWSFNNFEIDFFVGGYDQTFPVWVYSELRRAPEPADHQRQLDADLGRAGDHGDRRVAPAGRDESDERRTAPLWSTCCHDHRGCRPPKPRRPTLDARA